MSEIALREVQREVERLVKVKNFPNEEKDVPFLLSRISIELAEANEAWWDEGPSDHFKEELADVLMQLMHVFSVVNAEAAEEYRKKIDKNRNRDWSKKQAVSKYRNP